MIDYKLLLFVNLTYLENNKVNEGVCKKNKKNVQKDKMIEFESCQFCN